MIQEHNTLREFSLQFTHSLIPIHILTRTLSAYSVPRGVALQYVHTLPGLWFDWDVYSNTHSCVRCDCTVHETLVRGLIALHVTHSPVSDLTATYKPRCAVRGLTQTALKHIILSVMWLHDNTLCSVWYDDYTQHTVQCVIWWLYTQHTVRCVIWWL